MLQDSVDNFAFENVSVWKPGQKFSESLEALAHKPYVDLAFNGRLDNVVAKLHYGVDFAVDVLLKLDVFLADDVFLAKLEYFFADHLQDLQIVLALGFGLVRSAANVG